MSVSELVANFTDSCWVPMAKVLTPFLKSSDKKIQNFQLYFNPKKYNSTNKVNYTDKERYDVLVDEQVKLIETSGIFEEFVTNYSNWITELSSCFKSESVYSSLSSNFLKGSYGKMIDDFNRILLPKKTSDDDDNDDSDPTENLKKYVKNYSQNFLKLVEANYNSGYKLYMNYLPTVNDDVEPICSQLLNIVPDVFSIYTFTSSDELLGLWMSNTELDLVGSKTSNSINFDTFVSVLTNPLYTFNLNPEHQTNMDTIKRNWVNKQYDLFVSHVRQIQKAGSLYFYSAYYSHASDYETYSELQFTNAVNSFPVSFEDYTRNVFALFYFSKNPVKVTSYWITTKPIEGLLSEYDKALFDWKTCTVEEFVESKDVQKEDLLSILH
jgi:hypothetical protein